MGDAIQEQWELNNRLARYRGEVLINLLYDHKVIIKGMLIIDIGCGNGEVGKAFAKIGNRVVGLDLVNKNAEILGEATKLPFKNDVADAVLLLNIIDHISNSRSLVNEISRVLKKGGLVIIQTPNRLFPIDPSYLLPFLSYFPKSIAKLYLHLARKYIYLKRGWRLTEQSNYNPLRRKDVFKRFNSFTLRFSQDLWYPTKFISGVFHKRVYIIFRKILAPLTSPSFLVVFVKGKGFRSTVARTNMTPSCG